MTTSDGSDNLHLSFENDHIDAGLGDDFIEIDNHHIIAYGDHDMMSSEGGADVFMIRCGSAYIAGNGNSDHYFIKVSQKCKDEGYAQFITINEIAYKEDANKLYLCDFSFQNISNNPLDTLVNNGIKLNLPSYSSDLELYFHDNLLSNKKPDITINHLCDNYNETSTYPPISSILDRNGNELSLEGLDCKSIADYISTYEANNNYMDNSNNNLPQENIHNASHNPISIVTDYLSNLHLLSSFKNLISNASYYLGYHNTDL